MSVTIYTVLDDKSDEIIAYMEGVNADPESDWEFVFMDPRDTDLGRYEYKVQTDDKVVPLTLAGDNPKGLEIAINFFIEEATRG